MHKMHITLFMHLINVTLWNLQSTFVSVINSSLFDSDEQNAAAIATSMLLL